MSNGRNPVGTKRFHRLKTSVYKKVWWSHSNWKHLQKVSPLKYQGSTIRGVLGKGTCSHKMPLTSIRRYKTIYLRKKTTLQKQDHNLPAERCKQAQFRKENPHYKNIIQLLRNMSNGRNSGGSIFSRHPWIRIPVCIQGVELCQANGLHNLWLKKKIRCGWMNHWKTYLLY